MVATREPAAALLSNLASSNAQRSKRNTRYVFYQSRMRLKSSKCLIVISLSYRYVFICMIDFVGVAWACSTLFDILL